MAEGGEAQVEIKAADRLRMQGMAQSVVLEGRSKAAPALEAVDQRRLQGAERLARIGKWEEGLQELQGDGRDISRNLRSMVDRFGITRDPATGIKRRTTAEGNRFRDASTALDALVPILETEGFDQMTTAQQNALRAEVRTALLANSRLPDFARMTNARQLEIVNRFLRDPKLKQELFNVLTEVQGMTLTPETEALEAERKSEVSAVESDTARQKLTYTQNDLNRAITKLNEIRNNPLTATNLSVQATILLDQITQYQARIGVLTTNALALRTNLNRVPPLISVPGGRRGGGARRDVPNPDIQRTMEALDANARQQAAIQDQIRQLNIERIARVPTEESLVEERMTKFDEHGEARKTRVEAQFDERSARVERQELEEQRRLQEEAIVNRLQEAFGRSLARYVNDELRQSMEHFEQNEGKVQDDTMKAVRAELARHLQSRWTMPAARNRGIFRRRRMEPAINTEAVNRDFDRLMQAGPNGGAEPLMRDVLRRLRPADQNNVRTAIPPAEIERLMDHDTFTDELRSELLKQILARRAIIRPFRQGEMYQMTSMPPVRAAIKEAIEQNGDFRSFVEETVGTGDAETDPQGFWNRFSREAWEQPGLFLFPVTTIPWSIWAGIRAAWRGTQSQRQQNALQLAA